MNVTAIIIAALVVGAVGIILGFFLGISGEKFKVEVDPREEAILEVLPGNNCGGCGYAGCSGLAAAIAKGEAPVGQCPVGGDPVAAKVSGRSKEGCICKVRRHLRQSKYRLRLYRSRGLCCHVICTGRRT